jgi:hypothetical protein
MEGEFPGGAAYPLSAANANIVPGGADGTLRRTGCAWMPTTPAARIHCTLLSLATGRTSEQYLSGIGTGPGHRLLQYPEKEVIGASRPASMGDGVSMRPWKSTKAIRWHFLICR